eukprot:GHVT01065911.1.p1 GENE.GHVT01065911.1~~GHVT01065911.1.p1  ORF type:complete len:133 (-),score=5.56 GHVT01065911.1:106-504(-)
MVPLLVGQIRHQQQKLEAAPEMSRQRPQIRFLRQGFSLWLPVFRRSVGRALRWQMNRLGVVGKVDCQLYEITGGIRFKKVVRRKGRGAAARARAQSDVCAERTLRASWPGTAGRIFKGFGINRGMEIDVESK